MGVHAGEPLDNIIRRKKLECEAGKSGEDEFADTFWWEVGDSRGPAIWIHLANRNANRNLEILFSKMRSVPRPEDSNPDECIVWTTYRVSNKSGYGGKQLSIPKNVIVSSGAKKKNGLKKEKSYALVCSNLRRCEPSGVNQLYVDNMINLNRDGNCGNRPGSSQTTCVVKYSQCAEAGGDPYPVEMRANLARPYFVELGTPTPLDDSQLQLIKEIGDKGRTVDYRDVARKIRG